MSSTFHLSDYLPKEDDKFFFDTNVWLYLYCSVGNYKPELIKNYNEFFEKVLEAGSKIFTTSLQISEFFNAYCRIEHRIQSKENPGLKNYKKQFRSSNEFLLVIEELSMIIKERILKNSIKLDDNFSKTNIEALLHTEKAYDFNDEFFLNICEENDIIVVSNDIDLLKTDKNVTVISGLTNY